MNRFPDNLHTIYTYKKDSSCLRKSIRYKNSHLFASVLAI